MTTNAQQESQWRVRIGLALFIASIGWPLLIPVLSFLGLSGGSVAAFTGTMVVAAELLLLAAAAIAGKTGFALIKARVLGFAKSFAPPQQVSRARYTVGLVLFVIPLLLGWVAPYLPRNIPLLQEHVLPIAITGDMLLVVSLFLLGGDFWDKLHSLFLHRAKAPIPEMHPARGYPAEGNRPTDD